MRVISGLYKGRKLISPKGESVRPTADRVKESMFNILYSKSMLDGTVLDLFCGSGSLGIEALSRGAKWATFVDKDIQSVELTQQNLDKIKIANATVVQNDCFFAIKNFSRQNKSFDLILIDPPYNGAYEKRLLDSIWEQGILEKNGLVVMESSSQTQINIDQNTNYILLDSRKIGQTAINFFGHRGNL